MTTTLPIAESKIALTDRLRREDRWEAATLRKQELANEIKGAGKSRKDANEEAWTRMAAEYPPLRAQSAADAIPTAEQAAIDDELDSLAERAAEAKPDLIGDTLWVYSNAERRRIRPRDCPSAGAWGLLKWSRQHPAEFYGKLLVRALDRREDIEKERAEEKESADPGLESLAEMVRRATGFDV